ncbi:response regulator [Hyalangium minutum]|uniref:Two-component response regulator colocalized with HrtAB transporter n=1 Tax=Hyalangium minutum TaxID=394096 RepID=A0A085WEP2_9BACT|nr:response regulator [Hyalangium minutum]KFE66155.1 Two-component response regulator colocalized with HrtAB transporter [Hyalangium minutum]
MKTILVVDDDKYVRARVKSALMARRDEFSVLEASHADEAAKLVDERRVELVITDLWMPVVDGFQLLVHLMNHHPLVPVMVLSSHAPWDGLRGLGLEPQVPCLPKMINPQLLLQRVRERLRIQEQECLEGVTLFGFLQLLARERRTCMLEVGLGRRSGTIHVLAGEPVHATVAGRVGEAALLELVGWREPRLHMVPALPELKLTISTRMDWLLARSLGPGAPSGERAGASGGATSHAHGGASALG